MDFIKMGIPGRLLVLLSLWSILANGTASISENSTLAEEDFSGDQDETVTMETSPDVISWIQKQCRRNYRRKCTDDLVTEFEEDYAENRQFLSALTWGTYEVVYPYQVHKTDILESLSTRDLNSKHKHSHYHHTVFHVNMFGRKFKLKMELNRDLLAKGLRQKRHVDEKTQMITESFHEAYSDVGPVEHCYYQGHVRRHPDSMVSLSTCYGLSGVIQLHNESYIIQPLKLHHADNVTRHPHVVYPAAPSTKKICANERGIWLPYQDLHLGEFLRKLKIVKTQMVDRDVLTETKFVELALVLDYSMYKRLNFSYPATINYAIQMANTLDLYFLPLKMKIQLVYVEVWNMREEFIVSTNPRALLNDFLKYWQKSPKPVSHNQQFDVDVVHFLTSHPFDNEEVGMAIPESVCSERAVSVSLDPDVWDPQQAAGAAAHMIGHVLGIPHDLAECGCTSEESCIMADSVLGQGSIHPHHFSSCSNKAINGTLLSSLSPCLLEPNAQQSYPETCGNKIQERGEECDCGSPEECAHWDPCCDPDTCLLRSWATCRRGPCCRNCTLLTPNHICRPPTTECDVPEFCDGISGSCPLNELVQDGQTCNNEKSFCYKGICHTHHDQCSSLWGKAARPGSISCYEKFNPSGSFNGHCGKDAKGNFIKCHQDHMTCGLLHCSGGDKEPRIGVEKKFSMTTVVLDGDEFECKSVNSDSSVMPDLGMVEDGTKCGDQSMCINHTCLSLGAVIKKTCPRGLHNLTCSGRGLCTSGLKCFCDKDFQGDACELQIIDKAKVKPTWKTPWKTITEIKDTTSTTVSTTPLPTTSTVVTVPEATVVRKERNNVSTTWLIIVLACVAGGSCLLMGFCMICYRRRSPDRIGKHYKHKLWLGKMLSGSVSRSSKSSEGHHSIEALPRIISFGNMPSYRAEKIKALRRSMGQVSQASVGSEQGSLGDRESTELKGIPMVPLHKEPERGILKNQTGREEDHYSRISDYGRMDRAMQCESEPMLCDMGTQDGGACSGLSDGDAETGERNGNESESSIEKKEFSPTDEEDDSDDNWKAQEALLDIVYEEDEHASDGSARSDGSRNSSGSSGSRKNNMTPPPAYYRAAGKNRESGSSSSGSENGKKVKLGKLDDILRKIDKQAHALVNQRSPQNDYFPTPTFGVAEDRRGHISDTEAERRHRRSRSSDLDLDHRFPKPNYRSDDEGSRGQSRQRYHPNYRSDDESAYSSGRGYKSSPSFTERLPAPPRIPPHPHYGPLEIEIPGFAGDIHGRMHHSPHHSPNGMYSAPQDYSSHYCSPKEARQVPTPKPRPTLRRSPPQLGRQTTPSPLVKSGMVSTSRTSPPRQLTNPEKSLSNRATPERLRQSPPKILTNPDKCNSSLSRKERSPPRFGNPVFSYVGARDSVSSQDSMPSITTVSSPTSSKSGSGFVESALKTAGTPSQRSPGSGGRKTSPQNEGYSTRQQTSPGYTSTSPPPVPAIPYRGAKGTGGSDTNSPPTPRRKPPQPPEDEEEELPAYQKTPELAPLRTPQFLKGITHPLLDGYPFKQSSYTDGHNSEGYHSDKTETEDVAALRHLAELEHNQPEPPNRRDSYNLANELSDIIDF